MEHLLLESGFKRVESMKPNKSSNKFFEDNFKRFDNVKPGRNSSSLFIEAIKE